MWTADVIYDLNFDIQGMTMDDIEYKDPHTI